MGTILVRFITLLLIWTALAAGITWFLWKYADVSDWRLPFLALMLGGTALSAATAVAMGYFERRYL